MAFRDFAAVPGFGQRAQHWADALYFGVPGQQGPWPIGTAFGIHGVGLIKRGQRDYIALLAPMKLGVQEVRLDESELTDLAPDEETLAAIRTVLPDETADQVRILRIPPMIPNATAGTAVYGTMRGTAGPRVTWSNGHIGFLTAGHVAVGTLQVTDSRGATLGTTIQVLWPGTTSGGISPNVDVALIEPPLGAPTTKFAAAGPVTGPSPVDLHLAAGPRQSTILAMIGWYVWPGVLGTYVDLYMTNAACTVPGDSGAVVTNENSMDAVGTVVGGTKTFASFVQDIDRQIGALRTVTGLGSLSL